MLGDPVAHSLSPRIHTAAIEACGLDATYVARRCSAAELASAMRELADAGGGGNVTLPHKRAAAEVLDLRTAAVERTGACNTFWAQDGALCGDNTDVVGFAAALEAFVGAEPPRRVLLLGAGGAAAAVLVALLESGVRDVVVANRTRGRAETLVREVGGAEARGAGDAGDAGRVRVVEPAALVDEAPFDLAVNATSLGLHDGDPLPLAVGDARFAAAFDLVYAPGETRWVREARAAGLAAVDGREMLVRQAAAAFERWWGREGPVEVMRAAL